MLNPVKPRNNNVENVEHDYLYVDISPTASGHMSVVYYADKELGTPIGEYPAGFYVPIVDTHVENGEHISSQVLIQVFGFTGKYSKTHNPKVWVSSKNLKRSRKA